MTYPISGAGQIRPGNWLQALRNSSFEKSLIEFLAKVWSDDSFSEILRDKVLFLNRDHTCWIYESVNGCVLTEEVNHRSCSHKESSIESGNNVIL